jgi:RHH-type proline utilization regulon transcriptional repressor/proline dehydrogenase/delta 1-pyrroline-5-carboxylate dehydrogenase
LLSLGSWQSAPANREARITNPVINSVLALASASEMSDTEIASLFRAAKSDALALETEFSQSRDVSGLSAESNVFRYLNAGCQLRIQSDATTYQAWRAVIGALAGGAVSISAAYLPERLTALISALVPVTIEQDSLWLDGLTDYLPGGPAGAKSMRVRLIGSADRSASSPLSSADIAIWSGEVTEAGRVELLPYFHEQAISITAHRFGNPIGLPREVLAS